MDHIRAYEPPFGVVPERPIDRWGFPHEQISASEFDSEWLAARAAWGPASRHLGQGTDGPKEQDGPREGSPKMGG